MKNPTPSSLDFSEFNDHIHSPDPDLRLEALKTLSKQALSHDETDNLERINRIAVLMGFDIHSQTVVRGDNSTKVRCYAAEVLGSNHLTSLQENFDRQVIALTEKLRQESDKTVLLALAKSLSQLNASTESLVEKQKIQVLSNTLVKQIKLSKQEVIQLAEALAQPAVTSETEPDQEAGDRLGRVAAFIQARKAASHDKRHELRAPLLNVVRQVKDVSIIQRWVKYFVDSLNDSQGHIRRTAAQCLGELPLSGEKISDQFRIQAIHASLRVDHRPSTREPDKVLRDLRLALDGLEPKFHALYDSTSEAERQRLYAEADEVAPERDDDASSDGPSSAFGEHNNKSELAKKLKSQIEQRGNFGVTIKEGVHIDIRWQADEIEQRTVETMEATLSLLFAKPGALEQVGNQHQRIHWKFLRARQINDFNKTFVDRKQHITQGNKTEAETLNVIGTQVNFFGEQRAISSPPHEDLTSLSQQACVVANNLFDHEQLSYELEELLSKIAALLNAVENGNSLLHHFVTLSDSLGLIKYLFHGYQQTEQIKQQLDAYFTEDSRQFTPLGLAAKTGQVAIMEYLVEQGAKLTKGRYQGEQAYTVLHIAVEFEQTAAVSYLLARGEINKLLPVISGPRAPIPSVNGLHIAIKKTNLDLVRLLVEKAPELLKPLPANHLRYPGRSAWEVALSLRHGNESTKQDEIVCYLIEVSHKHDLAIEVTQNEIEPAVQFNLVEALKMLLKFDPSPLQFNALLSIGAANFFNPANRLTDLAKQKAETVLELLIEQGADPTAELGGYNSSFCHRVAQAGNFRLLNYLIERKTVFPQNKEGRYPLHCLAHFSRDPQLEFTRQLIDYQPEACEHISQFYCQQTPLHLAAQGGRLSVVQALLEYFRGKNRLAEVINQTDTNGNTALHLLAEEFQGHAQYIKKDSATRLAVAKALLNAGIDHNKKNQSGETALDLAEARGLESVCELLENYSTNSLEKEKTMCEEKINEIESISSMDQDQHNELLLAEQTNCFQQHSYHPSDGECAQLTQAVYSDEGETENLATAWQLVLLVHDKATEYQGAAYWHSERRQLVIAHRGTVSRKDWETNLSSIANGQYNPQMSTAVEFTLEAIKKVQAQAGSLSSISITGHSLGGWLAQLTAYHAEEQGYHPHVVSFDSPGCRDMLEYISPRNPSRSIALEQLDITVYLSAPNLVNTCDRHLGRIFRIYPQLPSARFQSLKDYFLHTPQTHDIGRIVEVFGDDGKPQSVKRMASWPSIKWKKHHGKRLFISTVLNVLTDKLTQDDDEYKQFFIWASRLNDYEPGNETLDFGESYQLGYFCHYRSEAPSPNVLPLSVFSPNTRNFLQVYARFSGVLQGTSSFDTFYAGYGNWNHLPEMLKQFQLEDDSVQLSLNYDTQQWTSYLSFFCQVHPDAAQTLYQSVNESVKRLESQSAPVSLPPAASALFKTKNINIKGKMNIHDIQIFGDVPIADVKWLLQEVEGLLPQSGGPLVEVTETTTAEGDYNQGRLGLFNERTSQQKADEENREEEIFDSYMK